MDDNKINKLLHKSNIIVLICGLLFLIAGVLTLIYGILKYNKDTNPVYLNDIIKDSCNTNVYSYLDLTSVSSFATEGDENTYFFVLDVNKYFYIVNMSQTTYFDIYKTAMEMGDDFHYELYGYTYEINDDIKKSAIEGFNDLGLDITLDEDNFEDYFGALYLNSLIPVDLNEDYFYIIFGSVMSLFGIILSFIYIFSCIKRKKMLKGYNYNKIYKELKDKNILYIKASNLVVTKNYLIFKRIYDIDDIISIYKEDDRLTIRLNNEILNVKYNDDLYNRLSSNKNLKKKENRN